MEEAQHGEKTYEIARIKRIFGTGVHNVIAYYLTSLWGEISAGLKPNVDQVKKSLAIEIELAAEGAPIDWEKTNRATVLEEGYVMVRGALAWLATRARRILVVEAPFLVPLDCGAKEPYWFAGTIDLAYEDHAGQLHLSDWKTGAQKPHPIVLRHGYQLGIYAHALEAGVLWPEDETQRTTLGRFPDAMSIAHLRDLLPYKRKTTKVVNMPVEASYYGVERGTKVTCEAGQPRGPVWYPSGRAEEDIARLRHSARTLVAMVRMGYMPERIGEHCSRCRFRGRCLEEGHVDKQLTRRVDRALAGVDLEGLADFDR